MDTELKNHLKSLAAKFENKEFLIGDPSWFMHQVEGDSNKELFAFIASAISYGSRKQFLPKIQQLLDNITSPITMDEDKPMSPNLVSEWLLSGKYATAVPDNEECFYRLYTNHTFHQFLTALASIIREYGSLKEYVRREAPSQRAIDAIEAITRAFRERGSVGVVPKNTQSSCKRVCMYLRWMVRDHSPVDLGIWADIIDRQSLIIPMDTHVVQEALRLGLTNSKSTSMTAAIKLTATLCEVFPEDPLKGDFALFGVGVQQID